MDTAVRTPSQIGAALRRQRDLLGLTQADVGKRLRLDQARVSNIEKGDAGVRLATLCKLLAVLDLELVVRKRSKSSAADFERIF